MSTSLANKKASNDSVVMHPVYTENLSFNGKERTCFIVYSESIGMYNYYWF